MITLHPFQQAVVDQVEKEIEQGRRKLLLVAPTGSGKTVMGGAIINHAVERHQRVLVIAHRREIITQTQRPMSSLMKRITLVQRPIRRFSTPIPTRLSLD